MSSLANSQTSVKASRAEYHGWKEAAILTNGIAEVVVVPGIGRVMQFRFVGEDPVFWENRAIDGARTAQDAKNWTNFGGDKSWPSPQADWLKIVGRDWPPPFTFDQVPMQAEVKGNAIELESPVDPQYGIRERREIRLDASKPVMQIKTTYEKVSGDPVRVGVGVITQLRDPVRAFMVLPEKSQFPKGYVHLQFDLPENLTVKDGLVSLTRSRKSESQIGSDASTLIWMDKKHVLRIDSPRVEGAEYADQGSSAIIYAGADPFPYVELETFGPLTTMKVGDRIERMNTYTLSRRSDRDPEKEARHMAR
ncbi:MAG TPA: hypothetical protein VFA68_14815 [Terriglobales bacterium]|nr:hypothetical protein [Terriglobales bacterium]